MQQGSLCFGMTWSLIYWRILQAVPVVGHPPSWQQLHLQGNQPLPGAGQQLHHHQQPPWHPPMLLSRPAQCLLARYAQVQHCSQRMFMKVMKILCFMPKGISMTHFDMCFLSTCELSTQAAPCPLQHASQELFSHFHLKVVTKSNWLFLAITRTHLVRKPDNALSSSMHLTTSSFPLPLHQPDYFFSPLQEAAAFSCWSSL